MAERQENQFLLLWDYMGKYHARIRRGLVCGLILAAVSSSLLVLNPWLSKKLIDEVIIPQNPDKLLHVGAHDDRSDDAADSALHHGSHYGT